MWRLKHMGYWADTFESAGNGITGVQRRTDEALDALLRAARPGAKAAALHGHAIDIIKPYTLHPVLSGSVGNRIGLSLDEGGRLTQDRDDVLSLGDVYTLHVGAYDVAEGGAFASAMIAVTDKRYDLIHRSPM